MSIPRIKFQSRSVSSTRYFKVSDHVCTTRQTDAQANDADFSCNGWRLAPLAPWQQRHSTRGNTSSQNPLDTKLPPERAQHFQYWYILASRTLHIVQGLSRTPLLFIPWYLTNIFSGNMFGENKNRKFEIWKSENPKIWLWPIGSQIGKWAETQK